MAEKRAELPPRLRLALAALAAWAFAYACYRGYYALGGQAGMIGRPVSEARFRQVNAVGAVILLLAALIPATVLRRGIPGAGRRRRALLAGCWLAAVGFCMHAVLDGALRILSLSGLHAVSYPPGLWATIDRRTADLQDLVRPRGMLRRDGDRAADRSRGDRLRPTRMTSAARCDEF